MPGQKKKLFTLYMSLQEGDSETSTEFNVLTLISIHGLVLDASTSTEGKINSTCYDALP